MSRVFSLFFILAFLLMSPLSFANQTQWAKVNDEFVAAFKDRNFVKAKEKAIEALNISKTSFAPDDLKLAVTYNNLAEAHRALNEYPQVETYHKKALEIRKQKLGVDHPHVAKTLTNLAELYRIQGKKRQALNLLDQAINIFNAKLGAFHSHSEQAYNIKAQVYEDLRQYRQAEKIYNDLISNTQSVLGPNHPNLIRYENKNAMLLLKQRKKKEGFTKLNALLNRLKTAPEPNTDLISSQYAILVDAYVSQRDWDNALLYIQDFENLLLTLVLPDHSNYLKVLEEKSRIYESAKKADLKTFNDQKLAQIKDWARKHKKVSSGELFNDPNLLGLTLNELIKDSKTLFGNMSMAHYKAISLGIESFVRLGKWKAVYSKVSNLRQQPAINHRLYPYYRAKIDAFFIQSALNLKQTKIIDSEYPVLVQRFDQIKDPTSPVLAPFYHAKAQYLLEKKQSQSAFNDIKKALDITETEWGSHSKNLIPILSTKYKIEKKLRMKTQAKETLMRIQQLKSV